MREHQKKARRGAMSNRTRNRLTGYTFLLPWTIGFFAFTLYPAVYSAVLSVCSLTMGVQGISLSFAGAKFYTRALMEDTSFTPALLKDVSFIAYATPIILVVAMILAMILNGKYRGRTLFRAIFFMPVVILSGPVISELLGKYGLDFSEATPELYAFLTSLPDLLKQPCLFVLENLVTVLWYSGVQILILLISIQRISPELYEAASIDGAGGWEKFWLITLPFVMPTAMVCALYTVVELANSPTSAVNVYINQKMNDIKGYYSFSTAMSWIYSGAILLMLLVVYLLFLFFSRKEKTK